MFALVPFSLGWSAQPSSMSPPSVQVAPRLVDGDLAVVFDKQLAALSPDDPRGYYLLGEELLDAAIGPADHQLASQVLILAFESARIAGGHPAVMAGACRALASMPRPSREKRLLESLVAFVDPSSVPPRWMKRQAPTLVDSTPYRLSVLLSLIRGGEGGAAKQALAKVDLRDAVVAIEPFLAKGGVTGGLTALDRYAHAWPCRECGNARIIRKQNTTPPEYVVCPHCAGTPGPEMTYDEYVAQIRLEAWLLQGANRSWAAQLTADDGAPLSDPDPASLCSRLRIDGTKMYWRLGAWVAASQPAQQNPPPALGPTLSLPLASPSP